MISHNHALRGYIIAMTSNQKHSNALEFDRVVDSFWDEILSYLWRLYSGAPEAEDSFQETFLRAFRAYPELDRNANVRAWLYRIATNVARTDFKRKQNRRLREQRYAKEIWSNRDLTHDKVEQHMLFDQAMAMVRALPLKQRAAFMLRKYQGCSYEEIGAILECSHEAARANVYQALRKLKAEAKKIEVEQP
jgi:RNA polymerase sigma-70 factor (ECF subfamily)